MIRQYYLKPILVTGVAAGILSGLPILCCLSFLLASGASVLALWWGQGRGGHFPGLGGPLLVGLCVGCVGMGFAAVESGLVGAINLPQMKSDPAIQAQLKNLPPGMMDLMPLLQGCFGGMVFLCFAVAGGLAGGMIWPDRGAPPMPPMPPGYPPYGYPPSPGYPPPPGPPAPPAVPQPPPVAPPSPPAAPSE